jgi:hypothetical protein
MEASSSADSVRKAATMELTITKIGFHFRRVVLEASVSVSREYQRGKYIIVLLTSCLTGFGFVCFANKIKNCPLSYS